MEKETSTEKNITSSTSEKLEGDIIDAQKDGPRLFEEMKSRDISDVGSKLDKNNGECDTGKKIDSSTVLQYKCQEEKLGHNINYGYLDNIDESGNMESKNDDVQFVNSCEKLGEGDLDTEAEEGTKQTLEEITSEEKEPEPVFDGTEIPEAEGSAWPEKAAALKNFVKEKGVVAFASFLRALSSKRREVQEVPSDEDKEYSDSAKDREATVVSPKVMDRSAWNPLNYIMDSHDVDLGNKMELRVETVEELPQPVVMKGRILLYTRLGCQNCKAVRVILHMKRLRYVEINIDLYPSRKPELEKFTGSSAVPKVLFNEVVIGGLSELKSMDESGKLEEKIDYLINEAPSFEAPLPPLSGEDDLSCCGSIDELALIVRKMKGSIIVKDRFYKMRRFTNCFLGVDAVDFLSEDQYLEREEAIEFGRKLARKLFFRHVLDENLLEDGNHLYHFMDNDPIVSSQCYNIPRGIIELKPKPIIEIASRLRFVSYAIFEAYVSEDGKHVDYRSIHGSEEFARYLRIIQELQRVELQDISREEKLAFFINLYNMMAIHAILVLGYPTGALERRKLLGDFKYVIGGCSYSLSAIQNGILRGNQRPPYNIMKPLNVKDKRFKVALPYPEPLIHFALVCGTQSGPALQCFSPGNIDKELVEAACNFLRSGGLIVDLKANVAFVSKILKWFSVDFGKNEVEVLKHASNYLEPANSQALLDLLASARLKVIYQPYDWGLNC